MNRGRGCLSLLLNLLLLFFVLAYVIPRIRGTSDDPDAATRPAEVQHDESSASTCMGPGNPTGRDATVADLDLTAARAIAADGRGSVWIAVGSRVLQVTDGRVGLNHEVPAQARALAAGPDGELAMAFDQGVFVFWADDASRDCRTFVTLPEGMGVGGLAIAGDGSVVMSYSGEPDGSGEPAASLMAVIEPDDMAHILGSATGEVRDHRGYRRTVGGLLDFDQTASQVRLDEPLGAITSLAALPDGRVAFTIWDDADVRLIDGGADGGAVRRVQMTPEDTSRRIRLTGSTPDGRLLGLAWGNEMSFQVQVIDADTGATETLADLEELADLEGGQQHPLDAAAVGDDVMFLAGGRLWRLANVFG